MKCNRGHESGAAAQTGALGVGCAPTLSIPGEVQGALVTSVDETTPAYEAAATALNDEQESAGLVADEREAARRLFVLRFVQPGLAGLIVGGVLVFPAGWFIGTG